MSLALLAAAVASVVTVLLLSLLTGLLFARSACRRVSNREPPGWLLLSLLRVVRPLGMLWQLATAPQRVSHRSARSSRFFRMLPLLAASTVSPAGAAAAAAPRTLLWDGGALLAARASIDDPALSDAAAHLRQEATKAAKLPPLSVTQKERAPVGGDLHDFESLSSYSWPCTAQCNHSLFDDCSRWKQPQGECNQSTGLPWVGHDGYNDPASARDRPRWSMMVSAVNALSASAFFFNDTAHAARAALLLRTWFLNNATSMRPNARFSQHVPGEPQTGNALIDFSDGADPGGGGNYDTSVSVAHLLDSVVLLAWAAPLQWTTADMARLQSWVSAWLEWITVPPGSAEGRGDNNRADFYDTLVASCAFFVNRSNLLVEVCQAAPEKRVAAQVAPDGSLPSEERRTKSESYHAFAIVALLDLAWICRAQGGGAAPDLFSWVATDGRSLARAVEWLAPYAQGRPWDAGAQVRPFDRSAFVKIFRTAAIGYPARARAYAAIAARQPNASASRQVLLRYLSKSAPTR